MNRKKNDVKQNAKEHLLRARRLLTQTSAQAHNEKELIAHVRQTRERLWSSKLASRS